MKKKAYFKNLMRMISATKARFLSIFCIIFLGASFFAGLRQAPLIMKESMNAYYQQYHWGDLNYIGTLGFDEETIDAVLKVSGVKDVDYGFRYDALMTYGDQGEKGVIVYTSDHLTDSVNESELVEGKFPTRDDECLLDYHFASGQGYQLNQQIILESAYQQKTYTIVGFINDTRYTSDYERGTNSLGDGNNSAFIVMLTQDNEKMALPQELFDLYDGKTIYNDLRIRLDNPDHLNIFNDDYDEYVQSVNQDIKVVFDQYYSSLHQDWVNEAKQKLADGQNEYAQGLKEYQDGYGQYQDGVNQYNQGLKDYQKGLNDYQNGLSQYQKGYSQYQKGLKEYQNGMDQYRQGVEQYQSYQAIVDQYDQAISTLNHQCGSYENAMMIKNQLETALSNPYLDEETSENLRLQLDNIQIAINSYEKLQAQSQNVEVLKANLPAMSQVLDESRVKLEQNKPILDQTEKELTQAKQVLDSSKVQLDQAKITLDNTKTILDETKIQLENAKVELEQAKVQLDDAQKQIDDIVQGEAIALTKNENISILSYIANCESIESLSILFPTIFFLVAALVSLTTMTRMVEEQRVQSGTLRALGYEKKDVIMQYLIYAFLATFFACLLGIVFGTYFFPGIIYYLYRTMMFDVGASTKTVFDLSICLQTFAISVAITMFVTFLVCYQEMSEVPAQILRPKAPKLGKRIILERITLIWQRLSFNQKVTMRNILRYKKRFFMSVAGIAGCTALLVVGFGLKQSISPLADEQYGQMWTYDGVIKYQDDLDDEAAKMVRKDFQAQDNVKETLGIFNKTISVDHQYATIEIPDDASRFDHFIHLTDYETGKDMTLNDEGVMINAKLAELLDVQKGDMITISLNNKDYDVKISGIYKLYFRHYIYMTNNYYEKLTGTTPIYNSEYFNLQKDTKAKEKILTQYGNQDERISSIQYVNGISESFRNQMESINSVVFILIFCAGALAFIVLYNLTNINIQERKSEIATIKVLGFYAHEVNDYVFRENMILAFIGSLVGLFFGRFIHGYLIRTVEIDIAMFIRTVNLSSYVLSIVLTMIFTLFIDFVMRKVLRNIDMVESLKSIE